MDWKKALAWFKVAFLVVLAPILWTVQALWACTKLVGRVVSAVIGFAFAVGGFAILLLFVPVLGWIILLIIMFMRRGERRHQEMLAAIRGEDPKAIGRRRPLFGRPWMLDTLKDAWRVAIG